MNLQKKRLLCCLFTLALAALGICFAGKSRREPRRAFL